MHANSTFARALAGGTLVVSAACVTGWACAPAPVPARSTTVSRASPPPSPAGPLAASPDTSVPSPSATANPSASAAEPEPSSSDAPPDACAPIDAPTGYASCQTAEVTGEGPCEAICQRPRRVSAPNRCCEDPVEVVVLAEKKPLLRLNACSFVPPDCADVHGHGNMDARLRVLPGTPPDVILVEGGCEARAMAHGYVPPGVAAWSGCNHRTYRWDGKQLARVRDTGP